MTPVRPGLVAVLTLASKVGLAMPSAAISVSDAPPPLPPRYEVQASALGEVGQTLHVDLPSYDGRFGSLKEVEVFVNAGMDGLTLELENDSAAFSTGFAAMDRTLHFSGPGASGSQAFESPEVGLLALGPFSTFPDLRNTQPGPPQGYGQDAWNAMASFVLRGSGVATAPFLGPGTLGFDLRVDPATRYTWVAPDPTLTLPGCCTVTQLHEGTVAVRVTIGYTPEPAVFGLLGLGVAGLLLRRALLRPAV